LSPVTLLPMILGPDAVHTCLTTPVSVCLSLLTLFSQAGLPSLSDLGLKPVLF